MRSVRPASDHELHMFRRLSLPLLGAMPLAAVALAGCGGNASQALPTASSQMGHRDVMKTSAPPAGSIPNLGMLGVARRYDQA